MIERVGSHSLIVGVDDDSSSNYTPAMLGKAKLQRLTETEGRILALIARLDAPTAYTIYAVLEDTPTSALQASKGTIYPVVERLKQRGYLNGTPNESNARGGETLSVTRCRHGCHPRLAHRRPG